MNTQNIRYLFWRGGFVRQHLPSKIKESLKGLFDFTDVKFGDIKKGQGDIVIINLNPLQNHISLEDYLSYTRDIKRIETKGIYTNIYFGSKFFTESLKEIG